MLMPDEKKLTQDYCTVCQRSIGAKVLCSNGADVSILAAYHAHLHRLDGYAAVQMLVSVSTW